MIPSESLKYFYIFYIEELIWLWIWAQVGSFEIAGGKPSENATFLDPCP
jgi:hypothetical protein